MEYKIVNCIHTPSGKKSWRIEKMTDKSHSIMGGYQETLEDAEYWLEKLNKTKAELDRLEKLVGIK